MGPLGTDQRALDRPDQLPLFLDPPPQSFPMELEDPADHPWIVGGEDRPDLLRRHALSPQDRSRGFGRHRSRRGFGVVIHPRPAANRRIPAGIPITVNSNIAPVTNMIPPNTTPLRLGRSGPTQSRSRSSFVCISFPPLEVETRQTGRP